MKRLLLPRQAGTRRVAASSRAVPCGGAFLGVVLVLGTAVVGCAAPPPGRIVGWGRTVCPQVEPGMQFTAVAAGASFTLALSTNGTVVGWGLNTSNVLTFPPGLSNVVAIAAGRTHALALCADGTVVGSGSLLGTSAYLPEDADHIVSLTAGNVDSLAIRIPLKVARVAATNSSSVSLWFWTFAGHEYLVEFSPSLVPADWVALPGGITPGTGGEAVATDSTRIPK